MTRSCSCVSAASSRSFALEYERTPKAKRRYEFVRYKVEHEDQLRRFVYIAANYHLLN